MNRKKIKEEIDELLEANNRIKELEAENRTLLCCFKRFIDLFSTSSNCFCQRDAATIARLKKANIVLDCSQRCKDAKKLIKMAGL